MKEVIKFIRFMYSFSIGRLSVLYRDFLLIVLFIYVLYLIKLSDEEEKEEKEENVSVTTDDFDLEAITKAIEKDYKPKLSD